MVGFFLFFLEKTYIKNFEELKTVNSKKNFMLSAVLLVKSNDI